MNFTSVSPSSMTLQPSPEAQANNVTNLESLCICNSINMYTFGLQRQTRRDGTGFRHAISSFPGVIDEIYL
ncbi:hypothetical protein Mapa_008378 [Marchantia paleacea]|nr:hypothetical protein Mapa_008378 [Marchantia paleacea]